jgi:hypothetical protein
VNIDDQIREASRPGRSGVVWQLSRQAGGERVAAAERDAEQHRLRSKGPMDDLLEGFARQREQERTGGVTYDVTSWH